MGLHDQLLCMPISDGSQAAACSKVNADLLRFLEGPGAERGPIDRPIHGADQDGAAHDIAKGDRNEVVDDPG